MSQHGLNMLADKRKLCFQISAYCPRSPLVTGGAFPCRRRREGVLFPVPLPCEVPEFSGAVFCPREFHAEHDAALSPFNCFLIHCLAFVAITKRRLIPPFGDGSEPGAYFAGLLQSVSPLRHGALVLHRAICGPVLAPSALWWRECRGLPLRSRWTLAGSGGGVQARNWPRPFRVDQGIMRCGGSAIPHKSPSAALLRIVRCGLITGSLANMAKGRPELGSRCQSAVSTSSDQTMQAGAACVNRNFQANDFNGLRMM